MILAVDTSTPVCSVALIRDGEVLFQRSLEDQHVHVSALTPFMSEALTNTEGATDKLQALALSIGPGSFNGLRIGLASVKAFAWVRGLPVIPIQSLDALVYQVRHKVKGTIRALLFSHRNFVHYADYHVKEDGDFIASSLHYGTIEEALGTLVVASCGDTRGALAEWFDTHPDMLIHRVQADARAVGLLAESRWNQRVEDLQTLEPLYNAQYHARKWIPPLGS